MQRETFDEVLKRRDGYTQEEVEETRQEILERIGNGEDGFDVIDEYVTRTGLSRRSDYLAKKKGIQRTDVTAISYPPYEETIKQHGNEVLVDEIITT